MTPEEEARFSQLRHRFYRLAHHGPQLLIEIGALDKTVGGQRFTHDEIKDKLFEVANSGKLPQLEEAIARKESEILALIGHEGDPCIHCGVPHNQVQFGPCPVRKKQAQW